MGQKNKLTCIILFSLILAFSIAPNLGLSIIHIELESLEPSSINNIKLTNFSSFEKFTEDPLIYSSMNATQIDFVFNQSSPSHPLRERYECFLPENCSDFFIRLNVNYSMSSVSEGMITYFTVYGGTQAIAEDGIQDAWTGSQGIFYVNGWPFSVGDLHTSSTNSAGLAGIVTFEMSRNDNVLTGKILDESTTIVLHSYQWSAGLDIDISRLAVSFRTNFDATSMQATFFNLNASFTYETIDPTTSPSGPSGIFGFSSNSIFLISSIILSVAIILKIKRKKS